MVEQRHLKIAGVALNSFYFTVCNQCYVQVLADLDQFGRDNSHGTVVGWEGLVKPGHQAADGRRPFHQIDIITRIGQIK